METKPDTILFKESKIRYVWDEELEEYYFSVIDVVGVLSESKNPRKYWSVLKTRLKNECVEVATICSQMKYTILTNKISQVFFWHNIYVYVRKLWSFEAWPIITDEIVEQKRQNK